MDNDAHVHSDPFLYDSACAILTAELLMRGRDKGRGAGGGGGRGGGGGVRWGGRRCRGGAWRKRFPVHFPSKTPVTSGG